MRSAIGTGPVRLTVAAHSCELRIVARLGPPSSETVQHGLPDKIAANTPYGIYFFRSMTHSQCESPRTIFLVSLNVKFGFTLAATPSPQF